MRSLPLPWQGVPRAFVAADRIIGVNGTLACQEQSTTKKKQQRGPEWLGQKSGRHVVLGTHGGQCDACRIVLTDDSNYRMWRSAQTKHNTAMPTNTDPVVPAATAVKCAIIIAGHNCDSPWEFVGFKL